MGVEVNNIFFQTVPTVKISGAQNVNYNFHKKQIQYPTTS